MRKGKLYLGAIITWEKFFFLNGKTNELQLMYDKMSKNIYSKQ